MSVELGDLDISSISVCRNHIKPVRGGKWSQMPKAARPHSKISEGFNVCKKKVYKTEEDATRVVARARRARGHAERNGNPSRRREETVYPCPHGFKVVYHVSSLTVAEYAAKVELSRSGMWDLVAA